MKFRLIEIDTWTGAERDITWLQTQPVTHDSLQESIAWYKKNIVSRYNYRIEESEPVEAQP